jgi:hypothetical protein
MSHQGASDAALARGLRVIVHEQGGGEIDYPPHCSTIEVPATPVEDKGAVPRAPGTRSPSPTMFCASSPRDGQSQTAAESDTFAIHCATAFPRPEPSDLAASEDCFTGASFNEIDPSKMGFLYRSGVRGPPPDYVTSAAYASDRAKVSASLSTHPLLPFGMLSSETRAGMVDRFVAIEWLARQMREMKFRTEFIEQVGDRIGAMATCKSAGEIWEFVRGFHNGNVKTAAECVLYSTSACEESREALLLSQNRTTEDRRRQRAVGGSELPERKRPRPAPAGPAGAGPCACAPPAGPRAAEPAKPEAGRETSLYQADGAVESA